MGSDHDIKILNSLVTTTIDSADGFERAAADAKAGTFVTLFRTFSAERRRVVIELQGAVSLLGGTPNDDGSLKADLHRRWVDLRAALSGGGGDKAIVQEVERGEDHIKSKYDEALADTGLSETARETIRTAYQSIRAGHDTASALKHRLEAADA